MNEESRCYHCRRKRSRLIGSRFLAASLFFSACASGAAAAPPKDLPRYDIKADVDMDRKVITATQAVTFVNPTDKDLDSLVFHIYANRQFTRAEQAFMMRFAGYFKINPYPDGFEQGKVTVRSVTGGGQNLDFTIEGKDETLLAVRLARSLSPGQETTVVIDFSVKVPHAYGRLGWHRNILTASRWYPILSVAGDEGWARYPFYPFHRPFFSDAADYAVELTVPDDEVVIHSGVTTREEPAGGKTKKVVIATPLPVREFTFSMSPDYGVIDQKVEDYTVRSFYLKGDEQRARQAAGDARDLMRFYEKTFGPYPYPEFSIAPVYLGYGGEQMSNMILIDTRAYKLPGILDKHFDFLVSHETGHQWLYNLVGIDEYNEMWLEEGVNSYFVNEYLADKYGEDSEILTYPGWFRPYSWVLPKLTFRRIRDYRYKQMVRQGYDAAIVRELSSFQEPTSIFALAYGKGSRVAGMLKARIGEEAFRKSWDRIFTQYRFANLSVKDLQRVCEEESGQDLNAFFEQWLYQKGYLDQSVAGVKNGTILLRNRGVVRSPAKVAVSYRDGSREAVDWDGADKDLRAAQGKRIARVEIDPGAVLLDIDRVNNVWPRKVAWRPVPLYFGLYDMPLFNEEGAYNVVIGPELANSGLGVKVSWQKPYDQIIYAGSDYEFGEQLHHSRIGYQLKNVGQSPTTLGFELSNTNDLDDGQDDLVSGKMYLRRELWPAQYGLTDINDHVSLYLLRNRSINDGADFISGREDARNVDYSRRNESIAGVNLHLNRSGPYPNPRQGWQADLTAESAGHFWKATQYFNRADLDVSYYQPLPKQCVLALRTKYGWGSPSDKNLYTLGGPTGLRGYNRKDIRGSNMFLAGTELRVPLARDLDLYFCDNLFTLNAVYGTVFFDAGQAWYDDFRASELKKDAGGGLRFEVSVGSFLEKVIVRLDVAQAVNDSEEETRFWFGVGHAF